MNAVATAKVAAQNLPEMAPNPVDPFDELPLPYLEIDARGVITRANRASRALHHLGCGQLIGQMAWNFVAADEKDPSFAAYCLTLESGKEPAVVRRSLYDRSGQFHTYEMHRSLIRDAEGNPAGMRMLCVDVSKTEKTLEAAQRKALGLESVIESICEAVIVTDAVGFIRSANPAAEILLGWQASELTGMSIEKGVPVVAYLSGDCSDLKFTMCLEASTKGIATILDRLRREIHIGIGTSPIFDKESSSTIGVVLLLHKLELPA